MADEKPKTVTVESLEWHTYNGKEYPVGAKYDIDEQLVGSVQAQGKAVRVDRVAHAKAAEKAAAKPAETAKPAKPAKPGRVSKTAVAPMTLSDKAVRPSGAKAKRAAKKRR